MDLDSAGPPWYCFLPQLHEDNFTVQFQGIFSCTMNTCTVIVLFIQIYICSYSSTLPVRMSGSAPFLRIFVFSSLWFVIKNVIIPDLTKRLADFLTWIVERALSHVIGDNFFFPISQRSVWFCWASCLYMMSSLFSSLLSSLRYVYLYFCFWSVSCCYSSNVVTWTAIDLKKKQSFCYFSAFAALIASRSDTFENPLIKY